jgi:hypothetical protein
MSGWGTRADVGGGESINGTALPTATLRKINSCLLNLLDLLELLGLLGLL